MSLWESTGEIREPELGETFLTEHINLRFWGRTVTKQGDAFWAAGPRVIMRKVKPARKQPKAKP